MTNLTDRMVASLKPVEGRQVDYPDATAPGLSLRMSPGGTKTWLIRYRTPSGRQRRYKLGVYPAVGLADARRKALKIKAAVLEGADPAAERKHQREVERETFAALADRYIDQHARARKRSWQEDERMLDLDLRPILGGLEPAAIKHADIERVLARPLDRGSPIAANRTLALCRKMFNWAGVRPNPCDGIPMPGVETARDRHFRHDELRTIWNRLEAGAADPSGKLVKMTEPTQIALKLLFLTAQRRSEVAGMRRAEYDRAAAMWTIPTARAKGKRAQRVPLSEPAIQLLDRAFELTAGMETEFTFPTTRHTRAGPAGAGHVSGAALLRALKRVLVGSGVHDVDVHDIRRTVATEIAAMGYSSDVVSGLLNHAPATVTRRHYDHHQYEPQKRQALEAWAARLERIVEGTGHVDKEG